MASRFRTGTPNAKFNGNDPASEYWRAAGLSIDHQTLTSMAIDIHPNDLRKRVPPVGPYTQAWQGVQKKNPVADIGILHAWLSYNPLQSQRMVLPGTQKGNPTPTFFGSGPVTSQLQQEGSMYAYAAPPRRGLLATILGRFGVGNG